jgi:hypothetical protein
MRRFGLFLESRKGDEEQMFRVDGRCGITTVSSPPDSRGRKVRGKGERRACMMWTEQAAKYERPRASRHENINSQK